MRQLTEDGSLILVLLLAAILYLRGARGSFGMRAAFLSALALFWAAFSSVFDALTHELFAVHMAQHLLLILIVAPLLVFARPFAAFGAALPRRLRKPLTLLLARTGAAGLAGRQFFAVFAWLAFCGVFVFWHLPRPYALSYNHEGAHYLEHASLLASAYAFWAATLERALRPRIGNGVALLHVSSAAVVSGLPGALMILAARPFYPEHAAGAARWGLTLVEDQQLAGLIMWVPAGFIYLVLISLLLLRWLWQDEKESAQARRRMTLALLIIMLAPQTRALAQTPEPGGDPNRGAQIIEEKGCGACHEIPGVTGAHGTVGPPLTDVGKRVFLAGELRNTPANMAAWIMDPQKFHPGSAMPNMGLTAKEAHDVTAYLETLH